VIQVSSESGIKIHVLSVSCINLMSQRECVMSHLIRVSSESCIKV